MPRERMEGLLLPAAPLLPGFLALTLGLARAGVGLGIQSVPET